EIFSRIALRDGHHYEVRVNDSTDNPRIDELIREIDTPKSSAQLSIAVIGVVLAGRRHRGRWRSQSLWSMRFQHRLRLATRISQELCRTFAVLFGGQKRKYLIYGGRYWDRTSGPCRVKRK